MYLVKWLCSILFSGFALADIECSRLCASETCCKGTDNKLLCCPVSGGICCDSGNTCCPPGTICQSDGFCSKVHSGFFNFIKRFTQTPPQAQIRTDPPRIIKKNLKSCLSTCGDLCCPLEKGVCCEDGEHCCPAGYKCDIATQSCRLSLTDHTPGDSHNCPLSDLDCSRSETCCILMDGSKGCCPYPNANCCADGAHCCPEGTVCNSDSSACIPKSGAWVNPFEPSPKLFGRKSVVCPGGKVACNKGSTCCKSAGGDDSNYSCCPHDNAVCCGDGEHCCPEGYKCDPSNGGSCVRSSSEIVKKSVGGNKCNDGQTVCPDDFTCCFLGDGTYGCCPLPNAVCCEDNEHCCPNGYKCDVANGTCIQNSNNSVTVPISKKFVPSSASEDVKTSKCQYDWTPCPANGRTGCCPLKDAVCCSDGLTCCLGDSTCLNNGYCLMNTEGYNYQKTYARAARLL